MDKKAHFVPEARVVAHRERWLSLDFHQFPGSRHSHNALDDAETQRDTLSSSGTQPRHNDNFNFNDDDHHEPPRSLRHTAGVSLGVSHRYATHQDSTHATHQDTQPVSSLPFDERPLPTHHTRHSQQKRVTIRDTQDTDKDNIKKTTRHTTTPLGQGGAKPGSAAVSKKTKPISDGSKTHLTKKRDTPSSSATQTQSTSKLTRRVATPSQRLSSTSQATKSKR